LDPTPTPKQQPAPAQLALPLLNDWSIGPVRLAPAANDRLWVAFVRGPETILALLDSAGRPVAGWPIAVPHTEGCVPHAASDGSVRLLCSSSPDDPARCPDGCMEDTVFAWTAAAKKVRGFPVVIASSPGSGAFRETARLIDDNLFVVRVDEEEDGDTFTIEHSLVEVRPDGALVMGTRMPSTICCTISADGIAFGSDYRVDDGPERTHMIAFDGRGMRTGWPITLDGFVTPPSFGPGGQLLASAWYHGEEETTSAILRLNPNGTSAAEPVQIAEAITWDPGVDGPLAPLADNRGRAWVVANGMVLGYDAQTDLPGFPYDAETGLVTRGDECGPEDTGCQSWIDPPRVAARGLIYSLEEAPSGKGERITVVNPDGSIRSGWPKTLQREGSAWESVTLGENNVAYAVAVEPEPQGQPSVSILAFAPNGTREWITTLVEP
jgi:hypothetical protein